MEIGFAITYAFSRFHLQEAALQGVERSNPLGAQQVTVPRARGIAFQVSEALDDNFPLSQCNTPISGREAGLQGGRKGLCSYRGEGPFLNWQGKADHPAHALVAISRVVRTGRRHFRTSDEPQKPCSAPCTMGFAHHCRPRCAAP